MSDQKNVQKSNVPYVNLRTVPGTTPKAVPHTGTKTQHKGAAPPPPPPEE